MYLRSKIYILFIILLCLILLLFHVSTSSLYYDHYVRGIYLFMSSHQTNAAKKTVLRENSTYEQYSDYLCCIQSNRNIRLLSLRAYRPLHRRFLHPHGNYSSPYPNHYKLTLI